MQMDVEFNVKTTFLPTKRSVKEYHMWTIERMNMNIVEPTEKEFPVAFVVTDREFNYNKNGDNMENYYDTEIRVLNGQLWRAVRYNTNINSDCGWLPINEYFLQNGFFVENEKLLRAWNDIEKIGDVDKFDIKKSIVLKTNRKHYEERINNFSAQCLIYDNKVWKDCGEPCYFADDKGIKVDYRFSESIFGERGFNALNKDKAIEYATTMALFNGQTDDQIKQIKSPLVNIKVLMPEKVTLYRADKFTKGTRYCPVCFNTDRFIAPAAIEQQWVVNENGEYIKTEDGWVNIIKYPNKNDEWKCYYCGVETVIKD